jgi:hypothetical protein
MTDLLLGSHSGQYAELATQLREKLTQTLKDEISGVHGVVTIEVHCAIEDDRRGIMYVIMLDFKDAEVKS